MPSSEYYEQGRQDASNGELNQLLYHTYLDYKRGHDEVRFGTKPRQKNPLVFGLLLLLLGAGAGWAANELGVFGTKEPPIVQVVTATPQTPTATFPFVIATPAPATPTAPQVLGIEPGGQAQVTTEGGALRVRPNPSTGGEPIGTLENGAIITIVGGPSEGDGYTWWEIEINGTRGWVAADFLRPVQ